MRLIFYYDLVCPYAYLASTRLEALAARAGLRADEVEWVPILLGGVFQAIGRDASMQTMGEAKARHNRADMARFAEHYGVALRLHPRHPLRTVEAMRLCHTVDGAERIALTHRLYRAHFVEGRDISDRAVLADYGEVGRIDAPEIKVALRASTDRAVADGVFGVPSFVVDDERGRDLFWGQDRMDFIERRLGGWRVS